MKYHYTKWLTLRITLSVSRIGDMLKNVTLTCINKHSVHFKVSLGECFALKYAKRRFTSVHIFNYLR